MSDLSQETFDRAEEIADALYAIGGLERVLIEVLPSDLDARSERIINALVDAIAEKRQRAMACADAIAHSDVKPKQGVPA